MNDVLPLDAAWKLVDFIGPVIWWTKAICGMTIAIGFMILPKPAGRPVWETRLLLLSRYGMFVGGSLLLLSMITPINAFGPLGDFVFFPAFTLNMLCMLGRRKEDVIAELKSTSTPEMILLRSLVAGKPSGMAPPKP